MRHELDLMWKGSTSNKRFARDATAHPAGKPPLLVSCAPDFGGDPAHWNPHDLFGASVALCHMLAFLSLASKARIDVRTYDDQVVTELDTVGGTTRVARVILKPRIALAAGAAAGRAERFFHRASRQCIIGNSITAEVVLEPVFEVVSPVAP